VKYGGHVHPLEHAHRPPECRQAIMRVADHTYLHAHKIITKIQPDAIEFST
jgi:hypothetical protein